MKEREDVIKRSGYSKKNLCTEAMVGGGMVYDWAQGNTNQKTSDKIENFLLDFLNERDRKRMILLNYGRGCII